MLYHWEFERKGEVLAIDVPGKFTLANQTLIVRAAVNGLGVGYVADWAVAEHIANGRLVRMLEDWTPSTPGLSLYYAGHRHVPAGLRAFVDLLAESQRHHLITGRQPGPGRPEMAAGPQ